MHWWDCTMQRKKELETSQVREIQLFHSLYFPLREVQLVENPLACQFQLVHSVIWTQHFYFPVSLLSKLFPFCSQPFEGVPVGKLDPQKLNFLAPLLLLPVLMSNWTKEVRNTSEKTPKNCTTVSENVQLQQCPKQRTLHQTGLPLNHWNCFHPLPWAKVNDWSQTSNHYTTDNHHHWIFKSTRK